jgi:tRNA threonylcarbamoyladenosine biosynthesis protein TsaB
MAKLGAMTACLLAFDTSTEAMAVALQSQRGVTGWNGEGGAQASAGLLPRIRTLMQEHALTFADLDAIAFGRGPGAFTGLRTACAVAQGLAFGAGLPVLPIDSLLIVAEDARAQQRGGAPFEVGVAMDARMGELYAGCYGWQGGAWHVRSAPALCDPALLAKRWAGSVPHVVAGTGAHLAAAAHPGVWSVSTAPVADRALALLRLAQQAWADGAGVDAALALPLYLRDKVALTAQERAIAKQQAAEAAA